MTSFQMKTNYRCTPALQQFYCGGPFAVSSDGSFIACACGEAIKIVDSANASMKSTIEGGSEVVTGLVLSPDDTLLFSADHSRQIRVWELSTLKCLRSWKGHEGPVMSMACHASGGLLVTGGADGKVLVWDVDGGFCTHYFKGHKGVVTCAMFHPDSRRLFSGSNDATVRVWDLERKKSIATLEKHFSSVTSLALSEDGLTLLSAGRDKVVNLWDLHSYSCRKTLPTYEVMEAICVIPSGTQFTSFVGSLERWNKKRNVASSAIYFVTVGERGIVRIWNSDSAICLYEQVSSDVTVTSDDDESRRGFIAAMILPSDQGLLCATADQQFLVYLPVGYPEYESQLMLSKRLVGYNEDILDMRFLGNEERFLAVATNIEQVRVYDLASMSCSYVLEGHTEIVLCLDTCVTSSGRALIVTGSKDKTVRIWDSENRVCTGVGIGHMEEVGAVAFSKKSKNFFVSGSSDRTIKVWSLDGVSDDVKQPVNLKTKAVTAAHDKDINSLAIAPNDSLVCSGSQDRTACVWKLPELKSLVVLRGHKRGIWSVEFSPVDQCVLTASADKTVKIWAIADGSCLKTFEGHSSSVLRASFISRGTQFVSCGSDGLVKLWTVKTNECIATYDQHEDKVWALAVGRKTEMLATGGSDSVINLWYDSTASDKEEAFRKEEAEVLRGQELENAMLDVEYTKAIQIALELRRPHRLFELFAELCRKGEADKHIDKALHALGDEEHHLLFEYVREWNTKPKMCHVAQRVLFQVFNILTPPEILKIRGIGELFEGLIPYSTRHYSRIDRLVRSTFLLDYILSGMSVLDPGTHDHVPQDQSSTPLNVNGTRYVHTKVHKDQEPQGACEASIGKTSKKRKSSKLPEGTRKQAKDVAYRSVSAISSQA